MCLSACLHTFLSPRHWLVLGGMYRTAKYLFLPFFITNSTFNTSAIPSLFSTFPVITFFLVNTITPPPFFWFLFRLHTLYFPSLMAHPHNPLVSFLLNQICLVFWLSGNRLLIVMLTLTHLYLCTIQVIHFFSFEIFFTLSCRYQYFPFRTKTLW